MITCPECGKEISDRAVSCPHCGYPIQIFVNKEEKIENKIENNPEECNNITFPTYGTTFENRKIKNSYTENIDNIRIIITVFRWIFSVIFLLFAFIIFMGFGIKGFVSFILLTGCAFFISPLTNKLKIDIPIVLNIIFAISLFFISIIAIPSTATENAENNNTEVVKNEMTNNENENKESDEEIVELEETSVYNDNDIEENDFDDVVLSDNTENNNVYETVFFYTLMDNIEYYNGKNIRTVVQVSDCYQSDKESYIKSQYSDSNLSENSGYVLIYPFNYQEFENNEYITIEGTVAKKDNKDVIANAYIVNYGEEAEKVFANDLEICQYEHNLKMQHEKESFIESCIEVSYDDLRRYPDSYENIPIKLTIYAEDVEPDGWIFPGDIIATFSGQELAVYDDRISREPRIMEGDTITVYAIGYGLSTIKVKQKGIVFNKTVDEYEVPAIKIKYTENDKNFVE